MTPQQIADLVRPKIEGIIPDLADGMEDEEQEGLRDSIYDYACDYIHDRYGDGVPHIIKTKAAQLIAVHYCGEEEA